MYKFLIFFLLSTNAFFCQDIKLSGTVTGNNINKVEFVNIGIKNKNIGTISDENGYFSIYITKANIKDSLTISYIGYKELNFEIEDILKNNIKEFTLQPSTIELDELIIVSNKSNKIKLGTKSYSSMVAGYVRINNDKNRDIQEFAKKINAKKPTSILDVNINLFNIKVNSIFVVYF